MIRLSERIFRALNSDPLTAIGAFLIVGLSIAIILART